MPVSSPPRRKSADAADTTTLVPIDPTLLGIDMAAGEVTARPSMPVVHHHDHPLSGDQRLEGSPKKLAGHLPWPLTTRGLPSDSRPTSSNSEASPSTPGFGFDSVYQSTEFGDSRQSSTSDFGSLFGASKSVGTPVSSESNYEQMNTVPKKESEGADIPPPQPKKSHARKVS
jgi:hypothetical protein